MEISALGFASSFGFALAAGVGAAVAAGAGAGAGAAAGAVSVGTGVAAGAGAAGCWAWRCATRRRWSMGCTRVRRGGPKRWGAGQAGLNLRGNWNCAEVALPVSTSMYG
jgi:hypothetical protein